MNRKMLRYVISWVLKVEGILMFLPALTGAIYRERQGLAYVLCGLLCIGVGFLLCWQKPETASATGVTESVSTCPI